MGSTLATEYCLEEYVSRPKDKHIFHIWWLFCWTIYLDMTRAQTFSLSSNQLPLCKKSRKFLSINQCTCLKKKLCGGPSCHILFAMFYWVQEIFISIHSYTPVSILEDRNKIDWEKAVKQFCSDPYKSINVDFGLPVLVLPLPFDSIFQLFCPWGSPIGHNL